MIRKKHTLAALAGLALAAGSAHGTLVIYEGFDYPAATSLSQPHTENPL